MPELAAQWDAAANGLLLPSAVSVGSGMKAWWQCTACPCGHVHTWQAVVGDRARHGTGCPVCSGHRPCACSSLAAQRPDIAAEWDTEGNGDLRAEDLTVSSNKKVVWRCCKHQPAINWTTSVNHRTNKRHPSGCPECAKAARRTPRPSKLSCIQADVTGIAQLNQTAVIVTVISTIIMLPRDQRIYSRGVHLSSLLPDSDFIQLLQGNQV